MSWFYGWTMNRLSEGRRHELGLKGSLGVSGHAPAGLARSTGRH